MDTSGPCRTYKPDGGTVMNKRNLSTFLFGIAILTGSFYMMSANADDALIKPICVKNGAGVIAMAGFSQFIPDDSIYHSTGVLALGQTHKYDYGLGDSYWFRAQYYSLFSGWKFATNLDGKYRVGTNIKAHDTIVLTGTVFKLNAHITHNSCN